jgi:hypothetical protein
MASVDGGSGAGLASPQHGGGSGWGRRTYLIVLRFIVIGIYSLGLKRVAQILALLAKPGMTDSQNPPPPPCHYADPPKEYYTTYHDRTRDFTWRCTHVPPHCLNAARAKTDCFE